MFDTLKEKRSLKFVRSYQTEFAGSTQNPKNIIGTSNQPFRTKIFPKKTIFSTLNKKRCQKFVWELPDGICRLNPKSKKKTIGTKSTKCTLKVERIQKLV
jgi:hypothetical protein